MGRYAARRILQIIPVFFGTTFLIFAMVWALPGDPIRRCPATSRRRRRSTSSCESSTTSTTR